MKWELITPFITFFAVLLVQLTVVPLIAIAGVIPDLVLISLVYYSISRDQFYGTVLGGTYGVFLDLITGSLLGSSMLSKTIAGFTAGSTLSYFHSFQLSMYKQIFLNYFLSRHYYHLYTLQWLVYYLYFHLLEGENFEKRKICIHTTNNHHFRDYYYQCGSTGFSSFSDANPQSNILPG